jgi:hypothetical protein
MAILPQQANQTTDPRDCSGPLATIDVRFARYPMHRGNLSDSPAIGKPRGRSNE